ncbi:hypothetical protein TNCV_1405941 [Trichonephila clavipes]|nr:hypothetical protein TNCV_1405941 [Trichonephila clavipes]
MRNLTFRRTQRPKSNKIIPCKTNSGPPAVLTGEGIKLPCVFQAVREIYRNIFGFASFEKVDRFRSEIQLAGHPLRGLNLDDTGEKQGVIAVEVLGEIMFRQLGDFSDNPLSLTCTAGNQANVNSSIAWNISQFCSSFENRLRHIR